MWTILKTAPELRQELGQRIKARRRRLSLTQQESALRAGVAYRTWRRLEAEGRASIDDLVRATIALRCEEGLEALFPEPVASNLDELLERQAADARKARPARAHSRRLRKS